MREKLADRLVPALLAIGAVLKVAELQKRLEALVAWAPRVAAVAALERLQAQAAALVATDPAADRVADPVTDRAADSAADSAAHAGDVPFTPSKED